MRASYFPLGGGSGDDSTQRFFAVPKLPLAWPSLPTIVPHRIRRRFRSTRSKIRSRQTPTSSLFSLNTSLSPADTLRALRTHQWSYYDAQYLGLGILGIFCLSVIEGPGPFTKTLVATLLLTSLIIPLTRQFFLPFLPIAGYLLLFYACQFISGAYRPPIWVRVLPALENILYGANLSNILSAHKSTVLDVLAWFPYGLAHFGGPFVCHLLIFIFGPPGSTPVFARAFGYMNIVGVATQLLIPCSPPWYENKYGLAPANYSIRGSPAGLAAIDKLLGVDLYTSGFTASPMVFGALPSLHSADGTIEVLFMSYFFPRLRPLFIAYLMWLWWSTMYFSHHYAVDLVAGSLISGLAFFIARGKFLPRVQPDKMFRWDYSYVEIGEPDEPWPYGLAGQDSHDDGIMLRPTTLRHVDSDDWTVGSSSSCCSSGARDQGLRSPGNDDIWEGDTLASTSDHEA